MSIPIGITKKEFSTLKRELMKDQVFVCLNQTAFIKANLVGLYLSHQGIIVKARIRKSSVLTGYWFN